MKKTFRKIIGFAGAILLMPFLAVLWIIYGLGRMVQEFCDFAGDFIRSLTDPEYVPPIGLAGFYAMRDCGMKALQAESDGRFDEARKYWKKCAAFYDTRAMVKTAEYCVREEGRAGRQQASEWYACAAGFGDTKAEARYRELTGKELSGKERQQARQTFIMNRKKYLQD